MNVSLFTRKKIRTMITLVCIITAAGSIFSTFVSDNILQGALMASIMMFIMSGTLLYLELFVFVKLRKTAIYLNILSKTVMYTIVFIVSWFLSDILIFGVQAFINDVTVNFLHYKMHIAFILSVSSFFLITLFIDINRLLGQKALFRLFTGKYHRPVEEERIFMFLDLASSTTIAENIGNRRFHSFLNDFFFDITEPVLASRGEIYKYVGDEVIITWDIDKGIEHASCIRCFFRIQEAVDKHAERFNERYGYVPRFRAGLHCGTVVVGEMGDYKREVAYLGDVVNTTARILSECARMNRGLFLSEGLFSRFNAHQLSGFLHEPLGEIELRGKKEKVSLVSVTKESSLV